MTPADNWPGDARTVFESAITVEYASLTRSGLPIMVPVTPYVSPDGTTLDISTGLTYPAKADRARRNDKVTLLFADPLGSGLETPPVVMVQGLASVRSADLQANTDRYVAASLDKLPAAYKGIPKVVVKRLAPYFARIWIEVTPVRMLLWSSRCLDEEPEEWRAPDGTTAPPSDPAPSGRQPAPWLPSPSDWRDEADRCTSEVELADLAWTAPDGWPITVPTAGVTRTEEGFHLALGRCLPERPTGPATLTFHTHSPDFTTQQNRTFVGTVEPEGCFTVECLLADVSLQGNRLKRSLDFLSKVRMLGTRLDAEAARYDQAAPVVRIPDSPRR